MLSTLLQDFRYGFRILIRSPGFAALAAITIALGVGANTTILSIVNGILLTPLPFPEPQRIMQLSDSRDLQGSVTVMMSYPKFRALDDHSRSFESLAGISFSSFQLGSGAAHEIPVQVAGVRVSEAFFRVLAVQPALGRTFLKEEDRDGGAKVAIISHRLWATRFGGDPGVIGRSIPLDGESATVIAVMPADFDYPEQTDIWLPRPFESAVITRAQMENGAGFLSVIGRLRRGVDVKQARAEADTLSRQYSQEHPGFTDAGHGIIIDQLRQVLVQDIRSTLLILLGAVGLVLLIATANVANLLLARAIGRQKEIAVRGALGAGRSRLIAQFLSESVLLAGFGAALGLALAFACLSIVNKLDPAVLPRASEIHIDGAVLGFTIAVSLLTGILFGLGPALHSSRMDLNDALKASTRGTTGGVRGTRLRSAMTIAEVAVAVILLTGAGLLIRSFLRLEAVDPGFRRDHLLTMHIALPTGRYSHQPQQTAFYDRVLERAGSVPGVREAAVTSALPLAGSGIIYFFNVEGQPSLGPGRDPVAWLESVSPGFFDTIGVPLVKGRWFTDADRAETRPVVVVNQTMARRYWPNDDPIGKHLTYSREHITCEVVGVVGDTKMRGLNGGGPSEQMYVPYRQKPFLAMWLVTRSASDPASVASSVRRELLAIDADQPVTDVRTMEDVIADSVARPRLRMIVMGAFAALAMVLAVIGIFGVIAWSVSQRTAEIGIRMALGAEPGAVRRMVVFEGMRVIAVGVVIGTAGALGLTRLLSTVLFGTSAADPATFAGVVVVLGAAALVACYLAAQKATRVDAIVALRGE